MQLVQLQPGDTIEFYSVGTIAMSRNGQRILLKGGDDKVYLGQINEREAHLIVLVLASYAGLSYEKKHADRLVTMFRLL